MPTVEFKLHKPELRWGEVPVEFVGGLWIIRGLLANDDLNFNATTQRYMSLGSPLTSLGTATPEEATFRTPKPFIFTRLAILFETAFAGGASASFRFYVDGTQQGIQLDVTTGEQAKVAEGMVNVPRDAMVCLECTADVGGTPNIQSIGIGARLRAGSDPSF